MITTKTFKLHDDAAIGQGNVRQFDVRRTSGELKVLKTGARPFRALYQARGLIPAFAHELEPTAQSFGTNHECERDRPISMNSSTDGAPRAEDKACPIHLTRTDH